MINTEFVSHERVANRARRHRIILLSGAADYRLGAFLAAAQKLGLDVVQAADIPDPLADYWQTPLRIDFNDPQGAARGTAEFAKSNDVDAILATDDAATLIAALASKAAGLPHNNPDSALAARDKLVMRDRLTLGGARVPWYRSVPLSADPTTLSSRDWYPCVIKPVRLSGSRGVIRANGPAEFIEAFSRTRTVIASTCAEPDDQMLIVEEYLPGVEVAVEALLTGGELTVLAIFDKPDPLEGPYFEETIYVTPSRLPATVQAEIEAETARAASAIGLRTGPVHAELRINDRGVWVIELAGRSIGGLCSTILEFGSGLSLEELILRNAVGLELDSTLRQTGASGVMMIPIPKSGILRAVDGQDEARAVDGITGVEITAQLNARIDALPAGASYLGFIFARGEKPETVERALRAAHGKLHIRIDPLIPLAKTT